MDLWKAAKAKADELHAELSVDEHDAKSCLRRIMATE